MTNALELHQVSKTYGSGPTEAVATIIERNGQVMADSAGADDKIFQKGLKRSFAVLSPAPTRLLRRVSRVRRARWGDAARARTPAGVSWLAPRSRTSNPAR